MNIRYPLYEGVYRILTFYKYSDAYVTTLVTKDRVTGNNPTAALYTADSYYRKKFFGGK